MNAPNKITLFRVVLIPVFVVFFLLRIPNETASDIIALCIFAVASLSDFLDGYLARKNNMVTDFGKLMDPLADKLLVCITLICFVKLRGADVVGSYSFPTWCAIIIMSREFVISGIRQLAADKGIIIAAGIWGKVKTVVQLFMCLDYIIMPEFLDNGMEWFAVTGVVLMYLATALTVISLIDYIVRNRKALEISYK
ncbi:MAG: CDP-diacylglycerol--glycerol-3-phosphate 3-phosphatidyltransferase [Lachnospiraceae bacterium]|jgi:CDP-diacylglycerol--glycerol-3-phosphate 3-phosphatidyltransferase|nr:CDP-diacylglycerol--glycerol-3-phosphate 3-phosphatidyltransferase [Lachnospiraceae bacterium]